MMGLPVKLALRFSEDADEAAFLADLARRNVRLVRIAIGLSAALFAAFVPLDRIIVPEAADAILAIRFGMILIFLMFLLYTYHSAYRATAGQKELALVATLAGLAIVGMVALSNEAGGGLYYAGLLLVFAVTHTLLQLRFVYASASSLIILLAYDSVAIGLKDIPVQIMVNNQFFLVSGMVIGMLGSYVIERYARRVFAQTGLLVEERRQVEVKSEALAVKNSDLKRTLEELSTAQRELLEKEKLLEQEKKRAEDMLYQIVPRAIAIRLREEGQPIADSFADVTVLFADLVDFSVMTPQLPPSTLVRMLNSIFTRFDELADTHGIEKVKTIGDAYMAVSGLPIEREDHAEAMAAFALDMLETIRSYPSPLRDPIGLRIGINTGPVVAGVIGSKRFLYDLWGDTVNLASRMETYAEPNVILVTHTTYLRLRQKYTFEPTNAVETKGGDRLRAYSLIGATTGRFQIDAVSAT